MLFYRNKPANMLPQDQQKQIAAQAALKYIEENAVIGVGTGSTVNFFIKALLAAPIRVKAAVSSSVASAELLRNGGIEVMDLNDSGALDVYIDGADEVTAQLHMIKGGGAALTREKIVAAASRQFVCIADSSKLVTKLGKFPLPVEVIPMARSYVARELVQLGGVPEWRVRDGKPVITDNGNIILDVYELDILDPIALESQINQIAGVVCNGLFARRGANILLLAEPTGVRTIKAPM
jgi:ribose 5-phosphate isomerase A